MRLCHTHTSDTQTSRPSVSSDVVRVQTTDRSKYLQPITLLVSMPDQNLTVAFKGLKTLKSYAKREPLSNVAVMAGMFLRGLSIIASHLAQCYS